MCFFFFKQKTAYEMRISDWSSDVCSSDLAYRVAESQAIVHGYLGIAAALAVVAAAVWLFRNRLKGERHEVSSLADGIALLKRRRFGLGALCIFLYVGAEVAIGSFLVNRSEEHTSELQSLMRNSYAVFCLKKQHNTF